MHSRIGIAISVGSYQACATDVASRAVGLRGRLRLVRRIRPHAVKIDRFGNPEGARVAVSTVEGSCLRAFCQLGKPVREESGGRGLPNRFDFTARARFSRHEAHGAVAQWGGVAWEPGIRAENRGSGAVWGHRACASARAPGPSRSRVGPRARPLAFARWSAHVQPLAFARWSARSMFHVRPSRTPAPLHLSAHPTPPRTTRPRARSSSGRFDSRVPICARILSNAAFFHRMVCIIQNASFLCICTNRR